MGDKKIIGISSEKLVSWLSEVDSFGEVEAFLWLVQAAATHPTNYRIGKENIELEVGELFNTVVGLAGIFGWTRHKTHVFIENLERQHKISTKRVAKFTVYRIENFEEYALCQHKISTKSAQNQNNILTYIHTNQKFEEEKIGSEDSDSSNREEARTTAQPSVSPTSLAPRPPLLLNPERSEVPSPSTAAVVPPSAKKPVKAPKRDLIGEEPLDAASPFPPDLIAYFESFGRQKCEDLNVWLSDAEADQLIELYGIDEFDWALKRLHEKSYSLRVTKFTHGDPEWRAYRKHDRDHAVAIGNLIQAMRRKGWKWRNWGEKGPSYYQVEVA